MNWKTENGEQRLDWLLKTSGVPERYRTARLDRCEVADKIREWGDQVQDLVQAGKGIIMFGGTGTGKSSAAALATAEVVKAGHSAKWAYAPDFCDLLLRGTYSRSEISNAHMDADVLILDDLGARPLSEAEAGYLDQIVERRYRRNRSMIVTTNIPSGDVRKYDHLRRMFDRWRETCRPFVLGGPSQRKYQ